MRTASVELPAWLVWSDPQRLGGRLCFRDTRVLVDALFENLEDGVSLAGFLEAFEGVTREQAVGVLEAARAAIAEPSATEACVESEVMRMLHEIRDCAAGPLHAQAAAALFGGVSRPNLL